MTVRWDRVVSADRHSTLHTSRTHHFDQRPRTLRYWNNATADFQSGQRPGVSPGGDPAPVTADKVVAPRDTDGDGIPDFQDPDLDGDGIPNSEDPDIDGDGIRNFDDANPYSQAGYERKQRAQAGFKYGLTELDAFIRGFQEGFGKGLDDAVDTVRSLPGQIVDGAGWLWDRVMDPLGTLQGVGRGIQGGVKAVRTLERIKTDLLRLALSDRESFLKLLNGDTDGLEGKVSPELLQAVGIARQVVEAIPELYNDWASKTPEEQAEILGKVFGYVVYNVAEGAVLAVGAGAGAKVLKSSKLAQGLAELIDDPQLVTKITKALQKIADRIELDKGRLNSTNPIGVRLRKKKVAPIGILSDTVRELAERYIKQNGKTVLGPFNPIDVRYTSKAKVKGASYFDIGKAWDDLNDAERWAANRHFLDKIADTRDKVFLSIPKHMIKEGSWLQKEIEYLTKTRGYRWVNQWSLVPGE